MIDRLSVILIAPYERWRFRRVKRQLAQGKFKRPADLGTGAVTTRDLR